MTNGVKSSAVGSAYANLLTKNQASKGDAKEGGVKGLRNDTKTDMLKKQIESGEYRVDIDKLAQKMAEELRR